MKIENESVLKRAQTEPVAYGGRTDIVMIHALLESLLTVFSTMMSVDVAPGVPLPKTDNAAKGDVSGLLGMKAAGACGSVALSLPLSAIREISRSLFGSEIESADKEAADLAGELTNMLVGGGRQAHPVRARAGFRYANTAVAVGQGARNRASLFRPNRAVAGQVQAG